ncbi:putative ribonuclease H-like domain-containing protein, partial [Tanacetum coccineum]
PEFPDRVYKVEKALYGLHQAPRAWYETLSTYILDNVFKRGTIDKTLFIKRVKSDILLVQVYVDDIIFGSTKKSLCTKFEQLMHKKFQMSSMGELTFFLRLQVTQKDDGIFISQDKYMDEILKKCGKLEGGLNRIISINIFVALIELRSIVMVPFCGCNKDDRERESLSSATSASLRLDLRKRSLYKAPENYGSGLLIHSDCGSSMPPILSLLLLIACDDVNTQKVKSMWNVVECDPIVVRELLLGLQPWQSNPDSKCELYTSFVIMLVGAIVAVQGWLDSLCCCFVNAWLTLCDYIRTMDEIGVLIAQNQIHKLLKGLPPIRSLVAVGTSAAKLVSLPVKNYKKDRRIVNSMQRENDLRSEIVDDWKSVVSDDPQVVLDSLGVLCVKDNDNHHRTHPCYGKFLSTYCILFGMIYVPLGIRQIESLGWELQDAGGQNITTQDYFMGQGLAHGLAYDSAPVDDDDDDSPVEEMSPIKAKKASKRASRAKKNDNKEKDPPKDWTKGGRDRIVPSSVRCVGK